MARVESKRISATCTIISVIVLALISPSICQERVNRASSASSSVAASPSSFSPSSSSSVASSPSSSSLSSVPETDGESSGTDGISSSSTLIDSSVDENSRHFNHERPSHHLSSSESSSTSVRSSLTSPSDVPSSAETLRSVSSASSSPSSSSGASPSASSSSVLGVFPFNAAASAASQPPVSSSPVIQPEPDLGSDVPGLDSTSSSQSSASLIARIHSHGVLGYILLSPDPNSNERTIIKSRIIGSNPHRKEVFNWKIHSYPQSMQSLGCSSITIGPVLLDLSAIHGQLQSDKDIVISSSAINLLETNLLGRTIVLHGTLTGTIVCATLLPAGRKKVFEAKFHSPISGSVKLIQTPFVTGILSEYLMYSDGSRLSTSHAWNIVQESRSNGFNGGFGNELNRCGGLSLGSSGSLILPRHQSQLVPITVSTEMPGVKGRSYQVLSNLRALDSAGTNYFVIFHPEDPNRILACAPIVEIKPKSARALFTSLSSSPSNVQGSIIMTQDSPFDATKVEVSLKLATSAYSYGIDLLPTIRRRKNEPKSCPNIRESIYNPFFKDPEEIPPEGTGTTDQFAVGDLSGKFGTLSGKTHEIFSTYDFNLPLYGQFSVIGRAIVIYAPEGPAIACTNIELINGDGFTGSNITTAYATFDIPLQGQFIFRQSTGDCYSDVYVYVEISKPDTGDNKKSYNHPWHIHENSIDSGYDHLSSSECGPAGKHFNPFNVSTECIYQRDCTMFTPLRCEMGDSSGKLGPIDVPTYKSGINGEPEVGKYYFIDTDLSLCGPTSIIGKSVVIHEANFAHARLTCANILEFKARTK